MQAKICQLGALYTRALFSKIYKTNSIHLGKIR